MPSTATSVKVVSTIAECRNAIATARAGGASIGFVPTMGALHAGHMSLVEKSRRVAEFTVMSIFVNPLQFGPAEDLSRYPRPVENDERLAAEAGVDVLFRPTVGEMYAKDRTITVTAGTLGSEWEGKSRPGHFDGVLTVVAKLFNIVQPDVAVFGRKDLQQAALVAAMVRELDMPVQMEIAPIVRESDGLALSSRNQYLSEADRATATLLSRSLQRIAERFRAGESGVTELEAAGLAQLVDPALQVDYLAVVDPRSFERPDVAGAGSAAIVAARVGSTRLIDNISLGSDDRY